MFTARRSTGYQQGRDVVKQLRDARRETMQLWIAIAIVLVLSAYRMATEMRPAVESFFASYTGLPVAIYILNGLFFWLLALLWIAYRRWRDALIAQQELEHVLMSISPDSLVVINRERVITMCSGQVEAMFGLKEKELLGKKTDVLYYDRRLRGEKGEIAARLERFGFHVGYATGKRIDGGTFPLEVITGTIRYQQGAVILMRDITERCNIEDALRHSEARFDLFMRYLPGFAFIKDSHGRRVYLNSNYERVLGWNISECIGKTDAELHNPELAKQFALTDAQVLSEARAVRYVTRLGDKGEERALLTVKFPIPASDEGAALIGGLCLDITEQEAAERERREIEHQMQQAQKLESLGLLAGGIAHDFSNLLMGMLGHADLALTKVVADDGARHHIEEVVASAQRAAELANQLLAYSGEGKFLLEVVNLSNVVEDLSGLLKVSITKKAMLHVNLDPALPPVECDATQIRQVLMNIIVNASDALENRPGTITVETGLARLSAEKLTGSANWGAALKEGDYVYVKITDTGIGMDEDTMSRIFDPFFSTKFAGHGLGLAAALGIVRSHHGTIRITSTPGQGSVFTVYLPSSTKPLTQPTTEKLAKSLWKGSGTVLLADDEDTVRDVATMMLEEIGFDVISVTNGREAVESARENGSRLSVILLDLTMPAIGGVEAYHAIRAFNSGIPIVLSSGYNKEDDVAVTAGIARPLFLKKPYRLDAMRAVFKRALEEPVVTAVS